MSKLDYTRAMFEAQMCENFINRFRSDDDVPTGSPRKVKNFAAKADDEQFRVTQCYKRALDIYCSFGKKEESIRLLTSLFWLVDTSDKGTITFAIQLLLALQDVTDCLEKFKAGTKQEVRERLLGLTREKLHEHHLDFWLLRSAVSVARGLAGGDRNIEDAIDRFRCVILPLEAHNSFATGNLVHAESCYTEAGKIAQQLGTREQAEQLFQRASQISQMLHGQPPTPNSIEDDLNKILARTVENITTEQLLPSPEQVKNEYDAIENKLETLLKDERFVINDAIITERAKKYQNAGLLGWIPARDIDQYGNPRTDFRKGDSEIIRLLEITYVEQIATIIGTLFLSWQKDGHLTEADITALLSTSSLAVNYDWRILQQGIHRHFERDYISSVHILIPQLENTLRTWAEEASIAVKKLDANAKGTVWGQKLLGDLLSDADVKQHLGANLVRVIKWYLDINEPFGFRHKVAHGFIIPNLCNVTMSSMLIWLTLLVITKPFPKDKS
ncbi:MAG: DUF4209 domain-containing protein [Anaerolinea sp.]